MDEINYTLEKQEQQCGEGTNEKTTYVAPIAPVMAATMPRSETARLIDMQMLTIATVASTSTLFEMNKPFVSTTTVSLVVVPVVVVQ